MPVCIDSICRQTLPDLEIILVDDGSTDRSGRICDEFAEKDSRIIVLHKENGGLVSARQAGLKIASGSYVGYVDGDDWIDDTMYEEMLSICEQEDADVVISVDYRESGTKTRRTKPPIAEGVYKAEDGSISKLIHNLMFKEDYSSTGFAPSIWNKLYRKELLCKYQFDVDQRITYGEDAACTYPCLAFANRVVVVDRAYYHYRIREGSISRSTDNRYFERISLLYQQLKASFLKHPDAECLMEQLDHYMLRLVLDGITKMFGFRFDLALPQYFPPLNVLQNDAPERIVLYGAGEVGRSYYQVFQLTQAANIVGWVDRQWKEYREEGLSVEAIAALEELEYDKILIAISDADTVKAVEKDLRKLGIPEKKIFYGPPRRLL